MSSPQTLVYLDTNVAVWLASGLFERFTKPAARALQDGDLRLSPMAFLELEYLYEIGRTTLNARDILRKLEAEAGLEICALPYAQVTAAALDEKWTRDPFDRMIVAQAKANGFAPLISADGSIRQNYPRTIW